MKLQIENTLTAQTEVRELVNKCYVLGRAKECDIILVSYFVSRRHAQIEYVRPGFAVEPCGESGTFVNDLEVKRGERVTLQHGDRIRIGEYVLSVSTREEQAAESRRLDLAKKFVEVEVRVHDELLKRLDLRKSTRHSTGSPEHTDLVHRHLTALLNEMDFGTGPEVEDYVIRETVKTDLVDSLTFQNGTRRRDSGIPGGEWAGENERESERLVKRLAADLRLGGDPEDLKENVRRLEQGFERAMDAQWLSISTGLKRHILKRRIRKDIHDIIFGLGPLQDLLNSPNISEIMVVSRSQIYIEKDGAIEDSGRGFVSDEVSRSIIDRIVAPLGRRIDTSQPLVDARLPDGSRVNAIIPPLALKGPCITIRKFSRDPFTIDDLIERQTINLRAANFLRGCVRGKKNIVISGGTGSGKTTLLNVFSGFIPPQERIVTIEDSAELQLQQKHVVQLETKLANIEGGGAFGIRDLVKNALRMRPDRIIVGECRGGETLDMLQAMNTGHSGSMTTAHANSPEDMVLRLETMALMAGMDLPLLAIRAQIGSALDVIVQQSRIGPARRVTRITEVVGMDEDEGRVVLEDVFTYRAPGSNPSAGELLFTGYVPSFLEELVTKNLLALEEVF